MASVRKFTFDTSFDDALLAARPPRAAATPPPEPEPEPEPEPPPPPPAPTFSEEELAVAREEAFVAGHAAALEEASLANARALVDAVQAVATQLPGLQTQIEQANAEIAQLAAHVAVDICRKLLPHCPEDYAAREIDALVHALLPNLAAQPRLIVRTSAVMAPAIRRVLEGLPERTGFEGRVMIIEDPAMDNGDTRVEWADGGAERNTSRLWRDIDALIERNIPHFSRGEALELPDEAADDQPADADNADGTSDDGAWGDEVWPEVDHNAYWTPAATQAPQDLAPEVDVDFDPAPEAVTAPDSTLDVAADQAAETALEADDTDDLATRLTGE